MSKVTNFNELNRMHAKAMVGGPNSRDWIEFSLTMMDSFPALFETAQAMNAKLQCALGSLPDGGGLFQVYGFIYALELTIGKFDLVFNVEDEFVRVTVKWMKDGKRVYFSDAARASDLSKAALSQEFLEELSLKCIQYHRSIPGGPYG